MSQSSTARPAPPGGVERSPGTRKEDWIRNQLRKVYDEALHEAIPADMLELLGQLDAKGDGEGDGA